MVADSLNLATTADATQPEHRTQEGAMNQQDESTQKSCRRWVEVMALVLLLTWYQEANGQGKEAKELHVGDVRSVKGGVWEESMIWERWNGQRWIPLLPGEFPGGNGLLEARVVIEHPIVIPQGQAIYVQSVRAEDGENLQVDGELVIGTQEAVQPTGTTTTASNPEQIGFAITAVYPNPSIVRHGSRTRVVIETEEGRWYQQIRLWIANESGQIVRAIQPLNGVAAGRYEIEIDLEELASGNYLLIAEGNGQKRSRQLVVVQ